MSFENIKDNYHLLKRNIKDVCDSCGRDSRRIKLVAVSKTFPVEDIKEVHKLGQKNFGENKVQELVSKQKELSGTDIYWHLVGHLQTNKVKNIIDFVSLIHSVDSLKLAQEIQSRAFQKSKLIDVLVQVNTSGEESKFGIKPEEAQELCKEISFFENVRLKGLMTIGKFTDNEDIIRSNFKVLKNLFDELRPVHSHFEYLSMGMTSDYKIAIQEGSNMIRVGSAIFGNRNYNN